MSIESSIERTLGSVRFLKKKSYFELPIEYEVVNLKEYFSSDKHNDSQKRLYNREFTVDKAGEAIRIFSKHGVVITLNQIRDFFSDLGFNVDVKFSEKFNCDLTLVYNLGGYVIPFYEAIVTRLTKGNPKMRMLLLTKLAPGIKRLHGRLYHQSDGSWLLVTHIDHANWMRVFSPKILFNTHFKKAGGDYVLGTQLIKRVMYHAFWKLENRKNMFTDINALYRKDVRIPFFVAIAMTGRGRNADKLYLAIKELFTKYVHGVVVVLESDRTDITKGFDGRKVFERIRNMKAAGMNTLESNDPDVGINLIYSDSLILSEHKWMQINAGNLNRSSGASERYKHHRLLAQFELNDTLQDEYGAKKIQIVGQHQSSFLHTKSRYKQALEAMRALKRSEDEFKVDTLCFLVRDQNTWMPGERKDEKKLRDNFDLFFPTDRLSTTFKPENMENDTGGLNKIGSALSRSFLIRVIRSLFLYEAIETIGMPYYQARRYEINAHSIVEETMSHPVNYIVMKTRKD